MAKNVYVVCEPTRIENNVRVKSVDVSPAAKWGKLVIVLQSSQSIIAPVPMVRTLNEALATFDEFDYLVPVGDPILMCAAASVAARNNNGRVKFLKWDRRNKDYMVVQIDLNTGVQDGNK